LLVLDRTRERLELGRFPQIIDHLRSGDILVGNDTRVIPARLLGHKESGGKIEILLVRRSPGAHEDWACLVKGSRGCKAGTRLFFPGGIEAVVVEGSAPPLRLLRFFCPDDLLACLEKVGCIPLPPYIKREDQALDRDRYQTIFAASPGAVAAPTAGLHFTPEILELIRAKGVEMHLLTLHVGIGTFSPVKAERIHDHRMHEERYLIPDATAEAVNRAKADGRRVIAIGTTTTRALESACDSRGMVPCGEGETDLFILPGFRFRVVDALVTNFHLPRSTLLMLVAAFCGQERILAAYRQAVAEQFRFFSYGDCMLVL